MLTAIDSVRQMALPIGPKTIEAAALRQSIYVDRFCPAIARPAGTLTAPSTFATAISTPSQPEGSIHPTPAVRLQHELYRREEDAVVIPSTEKSHEIANPPTTPTPPPPAPTIPDVPEPIECPMWGKCPSGYRIWANMYYCWCFPDVSPYYTVTTVIPPQ
jgi:hypothetical protein